MGQPADRSELDGIAVMSYSFDSVIKFGAQANSPERTIDILDFPAIIAERYGVHHVEIQQAHFGSTSPTTWRSFKIG